MGSSCSKRDVSPLVCHPRPNNPLNCRPTSWRRSSGKEHITGSQCSEVDTGQQSVGCIWRKRDWSMSADSAGQHWSSCWHCWSYRIELSGGRDNKGLSGASKCSSNRQHQITSAGCWICKSLTNQYRVFSWPDENELLGTLQSKKSLLLVWFWCCLCCWKCWIAIDGISFTLVGHTQP